MHWLFKTESKDPLKICKEAIKKAKSSNIDLVIIDSAGRLHVDEIMMKELNDISNQHTPDEILFVVDGMTGQDAVKSSIVFNDSLYIKLSINVDKSNDINLEYVLIKVLFPVENPIPTTLLLFFNMLII